MAQYLICNQQEFQEKYNDILELYCMKHRIEQKFYSLFPPTFPVTVTTSHAIEVINRVIGEGMAHIEKKCRKIRAGEVPFSDKLVKSGCCIKVWCLVIWHKQIIILIQERYIEQERDATYTRF